MSRQAIWGALGRSLVDVVFPPVCLVCDAQPIMGASPYVCKLCQQRLGESEFPMCCRCGSRVHSSEYLKGCKLCHGESFRFSRAVALGNYELLLRDVVHRIKRRHQEALAFHLGRILGRLLAECVNVEFDLVAPIPTHWYRVWHRGMNPAEMLRRVWRPN